MFISLNRKIIYTILLLFLVTAMIFISTFYMVYGNKIQNEQLASIQRNQQYIDLLYRNINISKELRQIINSHPDIKISNPGYKALYIDHSEEQLSAEQKKISEMKKIYEQRYGAIQESLKIFGISTILLVLTIIILGLLITKWILNPINKIAAVSAEISTGNLSVRIKDIRKSLFKDELDYLITTYNQMLDNLQNVISQVKEKEAFLQSLIDSIPDGIRVIDKDYNIVIANKAYYNQVGQSQRHCTKCYEASQKLTSPCPEETFNCPVKEILNHRKKTIKVIQQFHTAPNRHLSINAAPMKHTGKNQYVVEAIRDLSDDINFSHQQKLSSLGFLSTSIAHEIKNHLGALRLILERLLDKFFADKDDNDEIKKNLIMIYSELVSCIAVPERLLKLTRTSSDNGQHINIKDSILDIVSLLDFEAKSLGVSIDFSAPKKDIFIIGNEADFKMVVINIILNALKAMNNNGLLSITVKQQRSGNITISFSDNGTGIAPEHINRIFDPFFTGSRTQNTKGTGLGLSIAKTIVENIGGSISVNSTLGIGSCFTLSFPQIKTIAKK
ncbi:MAG: HAMP domain-containing protein [Alphaproteobacteria bacterium]|nr:HAMP domain-containing protein [Alphaproteobacteria bacterium]